MSLSFFEMCQLLEADNPSSYQKGGFLNRSSRPQISVQQLGIQPPVTDLATDPNSPTKVITKTDADPNSLLGQTIGPIGDKISRRLQDTGRHLDPKRERGQWDVSGRGDRTKEVGPAAANDDYFVSPFKVGGKDQSKIQIGNADFTGKRLFDAFLGMINKKQLDMSKQYSTTELMRLFAPLVRGQADPNYLKNFITKLSNLPAPPIKLVGNSGNEQYFRINPPKPSESPLANLSPIARQKALDPDEDKLSRNRERGLPYANPALHGGEADTVGSPQDFDEPQSDREQSKVVADLLTTLSGLHDMFNQEWDKAMQTGDGTELDGYVDEIQKEFDKVNSVRKYLHPEDTAEIDNYFQDIKSKLDQFHDSQGGQETAPQPPTSTGPSFDSWDDESHY